MEYKFKFRAWDKKRKKYIYFDFEDIRDWGIEGFEGLPNEGSNLDNLDESEQYTRLKDKNGKGIYEGDIVKARTYHGVTSEVVKYNLDNACFYIAFHDGSSTKRSPILLNRKCEVIGNINENPELLK